MDTLFNWYEAWLMRVAMKRLNRALLRINAGAFSSAEAVDALVRAFRNAETRS